MTYLVYIFIIYVILFIKNKYLIVQENQPSAMPLSFREPQCLYKLKTNLIVMHCSKIIY